MCENGMCCNYLQTTSAAGSLLHSMRATSGGIGRSLDESTFSAIVHQLTSYPVMSRFFEEVQRRKVYRVAIDGSFRERFLRPFKLT